MCVACVTAHNFRTWLVYKMLSNRVYHFNYWPTLLSADDSIIYIKKQIVVKSVMIVCIGAVGSPLLLKFIVLWESCSLLRILTLVASMPGTQLGYVMKKTGDATRMCRDKTADAIIRTKYYLGTQFECAGVFISHARSRRKLVMVYVTVLCAEWRNEDRVSKAAADDERSTCPSVIN
jgi:hypothetical protein